MNSNTTLEEVWALFRETDRKMQETFNRLTEEGSGPGAQTGPHPNAGFPLRSNPAYPFQCSNWKSRTTSNRAASTNRSS